MGKVLKVWKKGMPWRNRHPWYILMSCLLKVSRSLPQADGDALVKRWAAWSMKEGFRY